MSADPNYLQYGFESDIADLDEGVQRAHRAAFQRIRTLTNGQVATNASVAALQSQVTALQKSAASPTSKDGTALPDPPLNSNPEIDVTPIIIQGRGGTSPIGTTSANSSADAATGTSYAQGAYTTGVNDLGAATAYSIQDFDNGGIVQFNSPTAATATLNSAVLTNFQCMVNNTGAGAITLTPTSGLVNGATSITLQSGANAVIGFDGQNWASASFTGQLPTTISPVAGEYLTGYDASTGVFSRNSVPGISVTITTAKLTTGGTNGSQTFVGGLLTAQTAAT